MQNHFDRCDKKPIYSPSAGLPGRGSKRGISVARVELFGTILNETRLFPIGYGKNKVRPRLTGSQRRRRAVDLVVSVTHAVAVGSGLNDCADRLTIGSQAGYDANLLERKGTGP